MSDRFFLDTNIFIYSLEPDDPAKHARALDLIRTAIKTQKGIVSFQVVQEFLNVVTRGFSQPASTIEAEQYLTLTFRPLLAVHSSFSLYSQALTLNRRHSLSWYDSLIVAAAIEGDCRILYTEDLQHSQKFGNLTVQNPFR